MPCVCVFDRTLRLGRVVGRVVVVVVVVVSAPLALVRGGVVLLAIKLRTGVEADLFSRGHSRDSRSV